MSSGPIVADKVITSASNLVYSSLLDCLKSKGIKEHGQFVISGTKTVGEILERFPAVARNIVVSTAMLENPKDAQALEPLLRLARTAGAKEKLTVIALSKPLFEKLDVAGTHAPILVARTPEVLQAHLEEDAEGLEILCAMGDPANVGALIRSASAFGASKIILLQESASPFHPKAVRAASGTTFLMKFANGPSIRELPALLRTKKVTGPIFALEMLGESVETYAWPKNARLLIGEEGQGVPEPDAFTPLSISMQNGVESLNATVAASIALFAAKASRDRRR